MKLREINLQATRSQRPRRPSEAFQRLMSVRIFSDADIDWCTERVRYYIRRGNLAVYALERAVADFRRLKARQVSGA